jgi:hypothetical protein
MLQEQMERMVIDQATPALVLQDQQAQTRLGV